MPAPEGGGRAVTRSLFDAVKEAEVIRPDDRSMTRFVPFVNISPEARDLLVSLADYIAHGSWRCDYRTRYDLCCCGLDDLCDKLGLDRVPPNDPEAPK